MSISVLMAVALFGTVTIKDGDDYDIERYLKPTTTTIVILNDNGGDIDRFKRNEKILRERNIKVRFAGPCISACMMYMRLPDACALPNAEFWAHKPSMNKSDKPAEMRKYIAGLMDRYFIPSVVRYINERGGIWKIGNDDYIKIKAINHVRAC